MTIRQDRPGVVEAAKELQAELKQLPPDDPHVEQMRISGRDLIQHSKKVLAKEEMPDQMAIVAERMLSQVAKEKEKQMSRESQHPFAGGADGGGANDAATLGSGPGRGGGHGPRLGAHGAHRGRPHESEKRRKEKEKRIFLILLQVSTVAPQVAVRVSRKEEEPTREAVRKSAARVSSRASVVVQLAKASSKKEERGERERKLTFWCHQVRGKSKPKSREQLVEASDRVARGNLLSFALSLPLTRSFRQRWSSWLSWRRRPTPTWPSWSAWWSWWTRSRPRSLTRCRRRPRVVGIAREEWCCLFSLGADSLFLCSSEDVRASVRKSVQRGTTVVQL